MVTHRLQQASLLLIFLGSSNILAATSNPIVESIEGDKIVVVRNAEGVARVAAAGSEISFGDRVKTGPRASAKIRYPDGSKMLVGRGTELTVLESQDGVQYNELKAGEVRGVIRRPKGLPLGSPPRFVIKSQSAVMGVRGTDFVFGVEETSSAAKVHTLDGTVDVAKDVPSLMKGEGVPVAKDQMIDVNAQGNISKPQSFDHDSFVKDLNQKQPEFVPLSKNDSEMTSHDAPEKSDPNAAEKDPFFRILSFQFNPVFIQQQSGGKLFTSEISWNPTINVPGPFFIRGHLGAMPLKGRVGKNFFGIEGGALLTLQLGPLFVEGGGGSQVWTGGNSKAGGLAMANLGWRFSGRNLIDRFFIGASYFGYHPAVTGYSSRIPTIELKAGLGIHI